MKFLFHHDPMETMLDRFNRSERERMLPRWRRAAWRLTFMTIGALALVVWAIAIAMESH